MSDPTAEYKESDEYFRQVCVQMLGCTILQVPDELLQRLHDHDALVRSCNPVGNLRSTQVISHIVYEWNGEVQKALLEDSDWT